MDPILSGYRARIITFSLRPFIPYNYFHYNKDPDAYFAFLRIISSSFDNEE